MATETVSRNDGQAFRDAARAQGVDIEDCLTLSRAYSALAQWVEQARRIIEDVDVSRRNWPDLDRALKACGLMTGLDWAEAESVGLVYLMQEIEGRLAKLHDVHFPQMQAAAA
jgi:hypothetical protein